MANESKLELVRARAAARARAARLDDLSALCRDPLVAEIEGDYTKWLQLYYPKAVSKPMAFFHHDFWQWLWQIQLDKPHPLKDAFFAVWSRGFGKTTSGQLAIAALGARKRRRYGWLICRTQEQANSRLITVRQAIEGMGGAYLRAYPHMAKARTEEGHNFSWNTTRLICSDRGEIDFIIEAVGLDKAVRGANIAFMRIDLMMLDDIDLLHDSLYMVEKNIETLTKTLLPAGYEDTVYLGFQNLIHRDSIFAQIADGRAKFLMNREVSGPHPALEGDVKYVEETTAEGSHFSITSGDPVWPEGFNRAACEAMLNRYGPAAFETECQHNVNKPCEDATFREFDPVYHCPTYSEVMRFYAGNKAITHNLQPLGFDLFNNQGVASRLVPPRGECAMAQDWGNNRKHPVANRWLWRPGEKVLLHDSVFFIREHCWPTFPYVNDDPRANPTYRQLHKAILKIEQEMGIRSSHEDSRLSIAFRFFSHERPEGAEAYRRDHADLEPLNFWPVDTKQAKVGTIHIQEFLHVNRDQFHPFRIDPRTVKDVPMHLCDICRWKHDGEHLRGRPRAYWPVADGQGELTINKQGKLAALPAKDEYGQARTRFEYPLYSPRETADGTERDAPKINDDIIDTDRALMGYVFHMIKRLTPQEEVALRYREIHERLQGASYPDEHARVAAYMSAEYDRRAEEIEAQKRGRSWFQDLEVWEDA